MKLLLDKIKLYAVRIDRRHDLFSVLDRLGRGNNPDLMRNQCFSASPI